LKPLKKTESTTIRTARPQDDPRIPSNLKSLVFTEELEESCPWSLSGPQFPTPTEIQQRYCYPKGDPSYSSMKGGALWTYYDKSGKENLEYRLLHVYYSAKRAGNKGPMKASGTPQRLSLDNPDLSLTMKKKAKIQLQETNLPSLTSPLYFPSISCSFSDSPLSFDMPISPIRDESLVSLLRRTDSMDIDQVITPDRDFFESPYRKLKQKEKMKESTETATPEHFPELTENQRVSYNPRGRPHYGQHPWPHYSYQSQNRSLNEPRDGHEISRNHCWSGHHHPNSYPNIPTQYARDDQNTNRCSNNMAEFQRQLDSISKSLRDSLWHLDASQHVEGLDRLKKWSSSLIRDMSHIENRRVTEL